MTKTATLNLRIAPDVKKNAEQVLDKLGIPMSVAIDMYLKQIAYVGGIPFPLTVPQALKTIHADLLSPDELHAGLAEGYADYRTGKTVDAETALQTFKKKRS